MKMSTCIPIVLVDIIFFVGCGESTTPTPDTNLSNPMSVYNQAYQENYNADTIDEILADAKNAYVLLDATEDDIAQHVSAIKAKGNQVGAYISAGTGEDYREDFAQLQPYLTHIAWPDWPNEYFVSQTTTGIVPVMKRRIDKVANLGVDWIEFDNMDWLDEESRVKYNLTATVQEAQEYIHTLCDYTHSKGVKCMAKNTVEGFDTFDGVTYESFHGEKNWWDTDGTKAFLSQNKPVIIVHYNETDCDGVYAWYKSYYHSDKISFICEDVATQKYTHYNE